VYVAAHAGFRVAADAWPVLPAGFASAGIGIGCAETAESTVALTLPDRLRGTGSVCRARCSRWAPGWWPACSGPPSRRLSRSFTPHAGWPLASSTSGCCAREDRKELPHP